MIGELGHLTLIVALLMAVLQSVYPLLGAARAVPVWMAVGRAAGRCSAGFCWCRLAV